MKKYISLARPFTLLPPLLGIISGAICAWGSAHNPDPARSLTLSVIMTVVLGSLCASFLNAANNSLNQIYDLEIDRINKPGRPLVTGEISIRQAWIFTWLMYLVGVLPTWLVVVYPYNSWSQKLLAPVAAHECFFIYVVALISTFVYSVPAMGRTKAHPLGANLTIAIPRGCLLKVAGWTMVAHAFAPRPRYLASAEPWFIGSIFMLFLLGAASTKDFSDIEGDRAGGCRTLPITFGVRKAAWMIAPFFVFPWLLLLLGARLDDPLSPGHRILTGNAGFLTGLGVVLAIWGAYTVYLIVRNPDELTATENHPSWRHMYLMMMGAQVGFAIAYLV
ncbi:MAG: Homogentisate phytyltransferase [Acidobacteria bacterium]|nr:Homogentisate phytyltransferase [Acidobacteriota bacterium]